MDMSNQAEQKALQAVTEGLNALQEKITSQGKESTDVKVIVEKVAEEVKTYHETREAQAASLAEQKARIELLEKAAAQVKVPVDSKQLSSAVHSAFFTAFKNATATHQDVLELEKKGRTASNGQDGGFLIQPELMGDLLITYMRAGNPMLREASILTRATTNGLRIPRKTILNGVKASGELQKTGGRSSRNLTTISINQNRYYGQDFVTEEFLQAQSFETESTIIADIMGDLGWTIQFDMLKGDGKSKSAGLLNEAFSGNITWKDLFTVRDAFSTYGERYRDNGKYYMNYNTFIKFLTETDTQNRPIYMPAINGMLQDTIAGRPFVIMNSMDNVALNTLPILYGDMKAAYQGLLGDGYKVYRDDITRQEEGVLVIGVSTFAGGSVKDEEAIRAIRGS
jgi:HK97 family phage major capsid protein